MSASTASARRRPATPSKPATSLTIALDNSVRILKVVAFAERRGDATAARVLYEDLRAAGNDYLKCWPERLQKRIQNLPLGFHLRLRCSCATQTTEN